MPNISLLGPAIVECLKDGSSPVRLSAERCALHVFQLTKGTIEDSRLFFCYSNVWTSLLLKYFIACSSLVHLLFLILVKKKILIMIAIFNHQGPVI